MLSSSPSPHSLLNPRYVYIKQNDSRHLSRCGQRTCRKLSPDVVKAHTCRRFRVESAPHCFTANCSPPICGERVSVCTARTPNTQPRPHIAKLSPLRCETYDDPDPRGGSPARVGRSHCAPARGRDSSRHPYAARPCWAMICAAPPPSADRPAPAQHRVACDPVRCSVSGARDLTILLATEKKKTPSRDDEM